MTEAEAFQAIDRLGLQVFHRERWKGDSEPKWTVRKEDKNGNTLAQERDVSLLEAVRRITLLLI